MSVEYKVLCNSFCLTASSKARKIESYLNGLSTEGWEFAYLDPVMLLGIDIGFYLVVKRARVESPSS